MKKKLNLPNLGMFKYGYNLTSTNLPGFSSTVGGASVASSMQLFASGNCTCFFTCGRDVFGNVEAANNNMSFNN